MKAIATFFITEIKVHFDEEYKKIKKCYLLEDAYTVMIENIQPDGQIYYTEADLDYIDNNPLILRGKK